MTRERADVAGARPFGLDRPCANTLGARSPGNGCVPLFWVGSARRRAFVVADHLVDDEAQELLGEFGVEIGLLRQLAQPRNLARLAVGIGGGEGGLRLVLAHGLRDPEPLGEHVDQCRIDVVDALAETRENGVGPKVGRARVLRIMRHRLRN